MNQSSLVGRRDFIAGGTVVTVAAALSPISPALAATAAGSKTAVIAVPGDLDWFATLPGEEVAIHIPGDRVGGQFAVMESIAAPGAGAPPHIHLGADECFFIQEGQMHFMCDGVEFDASAGSSVVVPRGAAHSWVNLTDKPVRSLVSFTPGGIEQMFTKLAAAFSAGIEALAAEYDTVLVR